MLSEIILPHLTRHFSIARLNHCLFYEWNPKKNRVTESGKFDKKWSRVMLLISWGYVFLQIIGLSISSAIPAEKIFPATLTYLYIACSALGLEWGTDSANVQLMNIVYASEERSWEDCRGNGKILATIVNLTYSLANFSAYVAFPPGIVVMLAILPCQAPLLGYLLFWGDECSRPLFQSDPGVMFIFRMVLLLVEFVQICRHVVVAAHYAIYVVLSGILYFWEETTKILRFPYSTEGYRDLQVLESVLNASIRFRIFPTVLFLAPTMEILATFACIKYHDAMGGMQIQLLLIVLLALNATVLNVLYCTGAGIVCRKSGEYLRDMKGRVKRKVEKKLLKSYAPLKVRFGSNFMDELTPLVIQQFCSAQTANLLLLSYK
ncbi:hypothetical protein Fcan01_20874 [Folsomia candida]|uniref:Uncharacterized protein n=1 Tax=Folsomia candida TaxID=158441 RepID=A0A226DGB6_FOLCA|nr:hypothetical protein Fcan01_20874 [Folsomia candida]